MRKVGGFLPAVIVGGECGLRLYFLIIYLGFTAFFIKPFKIPTNSMWPTYNGMTSEVWNEENKAPGIASRTLRLLAHGAIRYEMKAPADGELLIGTNGPTWFGGRHRFANGNGFQAPSLDCSGQRCGLYI